MGGELLFGLPPSDWRSLTLGEACKRGGGDIQTGPFGSQLHASDYVTVGIPSIMPQNIGDNRINEDGIARIMPKDAERLSRYLVRPGDIVYSRRGDVERLALIRQEQDGWLCGTGCLRVRLGKNGPDPVFVSHYLGHPLVREWIVRHAHGATMPNLNTSILSDCPLLLPPLPEQRAIAHILGTLNDKIELNRKQNETLEAMARALFKDWFVDFAPVRARMEEGEPYLPDEIWKLFPDRLDEDGKPHGWRIVPASELIEFNPTEPLPKGTPAPYLDMASLPTAGAWPEEPVLRPFGSGMRFRNGDTLLARITPCLENGKTAFVQCLPDGTVGWGSTEFIVMRPKAPVPAEFGYLLARDVAFREHATRSMTGTSGRQRAQSDSVAAFKVAAPADTRVWEAFARLIAPIFQSIKANAEMSANLAILRDTLLPRLISGETRIKDAERFLREAGAA